MSIINAAKNKLTDLLSTNSTKKLSYNSGTGHVGSSKHRYNYVPLIDRTRRNLSYKEYQNILKDTQVKVGWQILKYFLISKNYTLTSNSDDPLDAEITEFIQDCFDNMEIPFREVVKNILTAIIYGYSVQERVYTYRDGHYTLKALYPVHRRTIDKRNTFITDENGDLIGIHQESSYGSTDLPIEKVVLYSYNAEFDEFEGNSILNGVKAITEDKDIVMDWLMTYANRLGSPVLYGKTDNHNHSDEMLNSFDDIANGTTGMTIGSDDELGVIESNSNGETYFSILQYKDNQIFRNFFIGNLLLGDTSQTGSYAQISGQQDFMLYIMNGILTDVAQVLQKVIDELVTINYGINAKSPIINFENFISKDILGLMNALKGFVDNGSFDPDNQGFKELLAKAFQSEADIKLDLDTVTDTTQSLINDTDFGYQEPLPGQSEAEDLLNNAFEGIL